MASMFRPCIDLHEGKVKQIVGSTLTEDTAELQTNFVSERPASWYAEIYKRDGLQGGHLILLGPGNEEAARQALGVYPGGLQVGGGINANNAKSWLEAGASHIIVTSFVFQRGLLDWDRLKGLVDAVGKERLVLDLSCRRRDADYFVVTDRWQKFTDLTISRSTLEQLAGSCDEFLIHAADVDGLEKFLSHLFRRVVMTISGVGLAIVSSILYLRVPSLVLLALGLFISFLLIALVFLLPNPQRYPFRVRRARKAGRMI